MNFVPESVQKLAKGFLYNTSLRLIHKTSGYMTTCDIFPVLHCDSLNIITRNNGDGTCNSEYNAYSHEAKLTATGNTGLHELYP